MCSGVPPQYGLYTSVVAGLVIALTGGSRFSVSGPPPPPMPTAGTRTTRAVFDQRASEQLRHRSRHALHGAHDDECPRPVGVREQQTNRGQHLGHQPCGPHTLVNPADDQAPCPLRSGSGHRPAKRQCTAPCRKGRGGGVDCQHQLGLGVRGRQSCTHVG